MKIAAVISRSLVAALAMLSSSCQKAPVEFACAVPEDGTTISWSMAENGGAGAVVAWGLGVHVFDLNKNEHYRACDGGVSIALSPDGSTVAVNGISLWSTATKKELRRFESPPEAHVESLAFSSDGNFLAAFATDRVARVWDTRSGKQVFVSKTFETISQRETTGWVALSPSGGKLAVGWQRTTYLIDVASGKEVGWYRDVAYAGQFTADGKQLVIESANGRLTFWDIETHKPVATLQTRGGGMRLQGHWLLVGVREGMDLYDLKKKEIAFVQGAGALSGIDAEGSVLRSVATRIPDWPKEGVRSWPLKRLDWKPIPASDYRVNSATSEAAPVPGPRGLKDRMVVLGLLRFAVAPDGQRLAIFDVENRCRVFDVKTKEEVASFKVPVQSSTDVESMSFSADSKLISFSTGTKLATVYERVPPDQAIVTFPAIYRAATGKRDNDVEAGEAALDRLRKSAALLKEADYLADLRKEWSRRRIAASLSPGGRFLAACAIGRSDKDTKEVRILEIPGGQEARRLAHDSPTVWVEFSADGKLLFTGSRDGTILIWDAKEVRVKD